MWALTIGVQEVNPELDSIHADAREARFLVFGEEESEKMYVYRKVQCVTIPALVLGSIGVQRGPPGCTSAAGVVLGRVSSWLFLAVDREFFETALEVPDSPHKLVSDLSNM